MTENSELDVRAQWARQFDRVRRRIWIVVGAMLLAVGASWASTASTASVTTYTSKVALTVVSQHRAPEQDAVLAQGYVSFFNDPVHQATLRRKAGAPAGVEAAAMTVAASPLIYITATAASPRDAQAAATRLGTVFRDEINDRIRAGRQQAIAEVRRPLDEIRSANGLIPEQALVQLQDRIGSINADNTNQLQDLQLESGASASTTGNTGALAVGAVGGLVLGCFLAVGLGAVSRRLRSAYDVRDKTGLGVVGEVSGDEAARVAAQRRLGNEVAVAGLPRPAVLAVVCDHATVITAQVARGLAEQRAAQGAKVLLVDADLRSGSEPERGLADYLSGTVNRLDDLLRMGASERLRVIGAGAAQRDPYLLLSVERVADLIARLRHMADLVVLIVPPVSEAPEAQLLCAAADRTLVVVERSRSRSTGVLELRRLLGRAGERVLGAVLATRDTRLGRDLGAMRSADTVQVGASSR